MNTQIEKLFETYNFSAKDRYEINQFFTLLPDYKKINFIKNFSSFAQKIESIQKWIEIERKILIENAIMDIKQILERKKSWF